MQAAIIFSKDKNSYGMMPAVPQPKKKFITCSNCHLRDRCLPGGLKNQDIEQIDTLVSYRRKVVKGEPVYHAGKSFHAVYAIRSGFFKSFTILEDGREQITGFQMAGEIVGMDGIEAGAYTMNVTALENGEICIIPFEKLEEISSQIRGVQRQFHKIMSRVILRDQHVMTMLGSMKAEERVAVLLLTLSDRFAAEGYSGKEFNLRMTREEIGSYLGLKLETVSRIFSRLQELGCISVKNKLVSILNRAALNEVVGLNLPHYLVG